MHWYTTDGKPMHTVIGKNGKERDTTLRDARKLNLIPSQTTITKGVLAAPGLAKWITRQALEQAYAAPPIMDESLEDCVSYWLGKADELGKARMDFGTLVHASIEQAIKGECVEVGDVTVPATGETRHICEFVNPVIELIADNGWRIVEMEKVLVGRGYAGRTDAIYIGKDEYGIIDFKTSSGGFVPPEYVIQIAAYHVAEHGGIDDHAAGYNILIDTNNEPGSVKVVKYDADALRKAYQAQERIVWLWQYLNDYIPQQ